MRYVKMAQDAFVDFWQRRGRSIKIGVGLLLVVALHVLLGFAIAYRFSTAVALLVIMLVIYSLLGYFFLAKPYLGEPIETAFEPVKQLLSRTWNLRFFPLFVDCFIHVLLRTISFI